MLSLILHIKIISQPAVAVTGIRAERDRKYIKIHPVSELKKQIIQLAFNAFYQSINISIRRQLLLPIRRQLQWPLPHHHLDGFFATAFEVFFL